MSRVAKDPVTLPANVEITVTKGIVTIKGPKGVLNQHFHKSVSISKDEDSVVFSPASNDPEAWAHAGTARANVSNMVKGVTEGFSRTLELVGVGYRVQAAEKGITLSLGFSHPIHYTLPEGIVAEMPNNTSIVLRGINKQLIGQVASEIRAFRSPEPYKGKGVKYAGEKIVRKDAKKK